MAREGFLPALTLFSRNLFRENRPVSLLLLLLLFVFEEVLPLAGLLWRPHVEGRGAPSLQTVTEIRTNSARRGESLSMNLKSMWIGTDTQSPGIFHLRSIWNSVVQNSFFRKIEDLPIFLGPNFLSRKCSSHNWPLGHHVPPPRRRRCHPRKTKDQNRL